MTDVRNGLRLKYGLEHTPTDSEARQWASEAHSLIKTEVAPEEAGRRAARAVFPDYGSVIFKAEADTIEALLDAARRK